MRKESLRLKKIFLNEDMWFTVIPMECFQLMEEGGTPEF